jgi:3-dehydrosphinganine reductase
MSIAKYLKQKTFKGTFSIVCGGSKGIGKAVAGDLVQYGGSVLILARNKEHLLKAQKELEQRKSNKDQIIDALQCDTVDEKAVGSIFTECLKKYGVPDYLINNVGFASPGYVTKYILPDFVQNMNINYYGQLVPTLALLPYFIKAKKGHLIFVSSMLGYIGSMGYATYCPTKFAVVGLAEALRHELKPYNIRVSVIYPPDTDTPGYKKENETKPPECAIITGGRGGLLTPEQISDALIKGIVKNKYQILPGEASFVFKMYRHFPKLVRWIYDNDLKKASKKLAKGIVK